MNNNYKVVCKSFNELNVNELYEIVKSRYEVFVCEQEITCENDYDDKDKKCTHLFIIDMKNKEKVIAYCRLLPPGLSYNEASIGRVLVLKEYRNKGIAKMMLTKAVEEIFKRYNTDSIVLSSQTYIKSLYSLIGFKDISDEYEEAGIPHIKMKLNR